MDLLISIFGRKAFQQLLSDDYVDWAGEMLVDGCDSHSLRILAGLDRRGSAFEAEHYFTRALKELNLNSPDPDIAVRAYGCEIARQIIEDKITAQDGVRKLYQICIGTDYSRDFMGWYELDDILDSLLQGIPYGSVTLENFDEITKQEAADFIATVCRP
jgi:hypothetical protein